jgi:hypothetical protein
MKKELPLSGLRIIPAGSTETWQAVNFELDGKHFGGGVFQRGYVARFVNLLCQAGACVPTAKTIDPAELVTTQKKATAVPVKQLPKFKPVKKRR